MRVIYYGFIMLIAFAPGFLARPVVGIVWLGIVLGFGVILSPRRLARAWRTRRFLHSKRFA